MNLAINFDNPTPAPDCGYKAWYRRKGDTSYSTATTSGSTSGETSIGITVSAPACYEGYVKSDCCNNNLSLAAPYGVNAYSPVDVAVEVATVSEELVFQATITSTYANPYDVLIGGTFNDTSISGTTTIAYTATYPAGSITATVTLVGTPVTSEDVISAVTITAIAPVFDNGGTLQQYDAVYTPSYFQFYDGSTSGVTWDGAPTTLPSFTLDDFNITAIDLNGNATAGRLLCSWIQHSLYGDAESPYNYITLQVKDADNVIIGSLLTTPLILGLINISIPLVKANRALVPSTPFTMVARWADNTIIASKVFYLPG